MNSQNGVVRGKILQHTDVYMFVKQVYEKIAKYSFQNKMLLYQKLMHILDHPVLST